MDGCVAPVAIAVMLFVCVCMCGMNTAHSPPGALSPANMYATEVPEWSKSRLVAYTGFTRTAWGAGLAALSLLWFSAPRNWISRLLSASFWYGTCACVGSCACGIVCVVPGE